MFYVFQICISCESTKLFFLASKSGKNFYFFRDLLFDTMKLLFCIAVFAILISLLAAAAARDESGSKNTDISKPSEALTVAEQSDVR